MDGNRQSNSLRNPKSWASAALIVAAVGAAYSNALRCPFLYDDYFSIVENRTIERLWMLPIVLSPPSGGITVDARPVLNLSLAVDHAIGGLDVLSYHVTNIVIHAANGVLVFLILTRSLADRNLAGAPGQFLPPWQLGLAVGLVWALHPIHTGVVTYIVQRAESLMAFFFLLTLYTVIRFADDPDRVAWGWFAGAACVLGMATKEVMVVAPPLVLIYDALFLTRPGSTIKDHRFQLYLVMFSSIALIGVLGSGRGGTAGLETGVSGFDYLLTQATAIPTYLTRCLWPVDFVFDYGFGLRTAPEEFLPGLILILGLLAATAYGLFRAPRVGYLGLWFFAILAPTSSFVPISTETMAEKRAYLPSLAVFTAVVLGTEAVWRRFSAGRSTRPVFVVLLVVATTLGGLTHARNAAYATRESIWRDTAEKAPENPRAWWKIGVALEAEGDPEAAITYYARAIEVDPDFARPYVSRAMLLVAKGETDLALADLERAVEVQPDYTLAQQNLGSLHLNNGDFASALDVFSRLIEQRPGYAPAYVGRGMANFNLGDVDAALNDIKRLRRMRAPRTPDVVALESAVAERLQP